MPRQAAAQRRGSAAESATPGRRRQPTRGDRREQALLDAMEELLAEVPLPSLSVDRIASKAGVGRTAFYFYFASKEAALRTLMERSLASIWQAGDEWFFGDERPRETLERTFDGLVRTWVEHSHLIGAVIDAASYDDELMAFWRGQMDEFIDAVAGRIGRDADRGVAREVDDPRALAETLCWMNERYCYLQLGPGPAGRPPAEVRAMLLDTWWRAIYPA
jgi:AcrR family transcriptional regulator